MIKNKKILLSDGCSWTWGDGLENHETQRWSYHLSKKLGVDDINMSERGSCNQSMVLRINDWFEKNTDKLNEIILVVGFTEISRDIFYNAILKKYQNINWVNRDFFDDFKEHMKNQIDGLVSQTIDIERNELLNYYTKEEWEKWWKQYFLLHYDLDNLINKFTEQIIYLQNLCKSNGVSFLLYESFGTQFSQYQSNSFGSRLIDKEHFLDLSFSKFISDNNLDYSDDSGHPGKKSHLEWSNFLYDNIMKIYNEK